MDPSDLPNLILQAALDRAARGPFTEDGALTPEAQAEVEAIAALASDDPEEMAALAAELASEEEEDFAEGQPCKRGEAAAKTGCIPVSGKQEQAQGSKEDAVQALTKHLPVKVQEETLEYEVYRVGDHALKIPKAGQTPRAYVMRADRLKGLVPETYLVEGEEPAILQRWVEGREPTPDELEKLESQIRARGVIPRDLNERNVIVDADGHIWAIDPGNFEVDWESQAAQSYRPNSSEWTIQGVSLPEEIVKARSLPHAEW